MIAKFQARKFAAKLVLLFAIVLISYQLLYRPIPKPALYFLADNAAGWLINEGASARSVPKRLANLWIEQSIIAHIHDNQILPEKMDDVDRIARRLTLLRPMLISQLELRHNEVASSTMLTGLGKCSGINNAAAILLSHDFSRVEMIDVDGDQADDGHSYGRLWSVQYKDWIYFDIWTPQVQIFRITDQRLIYLHRIDLPIATRANIDVTRTKVMHEKALSVHVQIRLQSTFGGYIWYRIRNYLDHGNTWEKNADLRRTQLRPQIGPAIVIPRNSTNMPRSYLKARLQQIFGDTKRAKRNYQSVAHSKDPPNSSFAQAASLFARQL